MKLVYLIGGPATGKTSIMAEIVKPWGPPLVEQQPVKHLWWATEPRRIYLGHPREQFGGTDTWAYGDGQKAVNWLLETVAPIQPGPALVVGEGDRLSVEGWLRAMGGIIVWCVCARDVLDRRRASRTQAGAWVKGRDTMCMRLAESLRARTLDTGRPLPLVVAELRKMAELPGGTDG